MNEYLENTELTELMEPTAEQKALPAEHAMLLGKYLPILFWILIATMALGLVTSKAGGVLNGVKTLVQSLVTGWVLLKLAPVHRGYRIAGILDIVNGVIGFATELIPVEGKALALLIVLLIPSLVISFLSLYREYNTHAEIMECIGDGEFADKWRGLWKWSLGLLIGLVPCLLIAAAAGMVGVLLVLADVVGLVVVAVLYAVYLWKMGKHFRMDELEEKHETML